MGLYGWPELVLFSDFSVFRTNSVEHCCALAVALLLYPEFRPGTHVPVDTLLRSGVWMGQRPTCDRTSSLARPPQTCTFWSKLWPVQIFVLAPKISQIPVLSCSKIRTFTQGEARCRVRLRSNFRHVAAAFLSHTGRFVIESICQENNIISNQ